MKLSVVTTMYYSAPYIKEFYERIIKTIKEITDFDDYEIIFVNDGSPDNSLEIALGLLNNDEKVKIIDLSRNFGQHKAIMTGLSHIKGDYIFLLDGDLEEEPELLKKFWYEMNRAKNVDVVYGVQGRRKGNFFERITGNVFYWLFNYLSSTKLSPNLITCRLMSQRYVAALVSYKEQEIFLAGLWSDTGFIQKPLLVNKLSNSPTTYNLRKKFKIVVNSITSFSNKPLILVFYLGILTTVAAFFYALFLSVRKIFYGINIDGWTSITVSIWLIGGIIIFSIGVIGIYLSKIFIEVKNRPYTIIKNIYEKQKN